MQNGLMQPQPAGLLTPVPNALAGPKQQLTPQQLEMLLKMLGNSQPTPVVPIPTSGVRG